MAHRSQERRQARQMKAVQKWAMNEKRLGGGGHQGVAIDFDSGVFWKADGKPSLTGGRRHGELTLAE